MNDNSPETPRQTEKCGTCAYYHKERPNAVMPQHFCGVWGQIRLPQYNACDYHTPKHTDS